MRVFLSSCHLQKSRWDSLSVSTYRYLYSIQVRYGSVILSLFIPNDFSQRLRRMSGNIGCENELCS